MPCMPWWWASTSRSGFEVETVPLLEIGGDPVTSTRIRGALARGRVDEAARLLGRWYALGGAVVTGDAIGRTLGVPTANLRLHDEKFLPADGIYAVWARIGSESVRRPGAMSIGVRPTFGGQERTLEVHLIDWSGDLLGADLEVELVDWIRPELSFPSVDELVRRMDEDSRLARMALARAPDAFPVLGEVAS